MLYLSGPKQTVLSTTHTIIFCLIILHIQSRKPLFLQPPLFYLQNPYSPFCSLTSILLYSLLSPLHPRLSSCAAIQSQPLQPPLSSLAVSSIFPFSLICLRSCPAASSILPCCVICPCLKHPLSHPEASFILCLLPLQPGIS
jgi:hypothetical protein